MAYKQIEIEPKMISIKQMSESYGISRQYVGQLIDEDKVDFTRIGGESGGIKMILVNQKFKDIVSRYES